MIESKESRGTKWKAVNRGLPDFLDLGDQAQYSLEDKCERNSKEGRNYISFDVYILFVDIQGAIGWVFFILFSYAISFYSQGICKI